MFSFWMFHTGNVHGIHQSIDQSTSQLINFFGKSSDPCRKQEKELGKRHAISLCKWPPEIAQRLLFVELCSIMGIFSNASNCLRIYVS